MNNKAFGVDYQQTIVFIVGTVNSTWRNEALMGLYKT